MMLADIFKCQLPRTLTDLLWPCKFATWHAGSMASWVYRHIIWLPFAWSIRNENISPHATHFHSSRVHFLYYLIQATMKTNSLSNGTLLGLKLSNPKRWNQRWTDNLLIAWLAPWFNWVVIWYCWLTNSYIARSRLIVHCSLPDSYLFFYHPCIFGMLLILYSPKILFIWLFMRLIDPCFKFLLFVLT